MQANHDKQYTYHSPKKGKVTSNLCLNKVISVLDRSTKHSNKTTNSHYVRKDRSEKSQILQNATNHRFIKVDSKSLQGLKIDFTGTKSLP